MELIALSDVHSASSAGREPNRDARERGVAVVLRGSCVLMVEHAHPDRSIWTLPGGGVEPGESHEDAAARELLEETFLVARRLTFLAKAPVNGQLDHYFLVDVDPTTEPRCGIDPEQAGRRPILNDVRWVPLASLREDCQMRIVAPVLRDRPMPFVPDRPAGSG